MSFVLDASMVLAWLLAEDASEDAVTVRGRLAQERAIVPSLWVYEVANALTAAVRRGRLPENLLDASLRTVAALPVDVVEPNRDLAAVVEFASRHGLSVYDAAYLQLAVAQDLPLTTLDDRLGQGAREAGVEVLSGRASGR